MFTVNTHSSDARKYKTTLNYVCLVDNVELTSELQRLKELMKSSPLTVENKVSYQCHYLNYYKILFKFYHNLDHYIYNIFILIFPTIQNIQGV